MNPIWQPKYGLYVATSHSAADRPSTLARSTNPTSMWPAWSSFDRPSTHARRRPPSATAAPQISRS
jgi:hypothetical protein